MALLHSNKTGRGGATIAVGNDIEQVKRIRAYRAEATRKVSLANKRIARLEKAGLTDSPAYKRLMQEGGKFGIKGKTYREVQSEVKRLNQFIESTTSTVRGTTKVLKEMAKNTGQTFKNLTELKEKSAKFFELASKTEQYLRNVHDAGSAIGYQKIWEQINTYIKATNEDLAGGKLDVDQMVEAVSNALMQFEDPVNINIQGSSSEWYLLKDE